MFWKTKGLGLVTSLSLGYKTWLEKFFFSYLSFSYFHKQQALFFFEGYQHFKMLCNGNWESNYINKPFSSSWYFIFILFWVYILVLRKSYQSVMSLLHGLPYFVEFFWSFCNSAVLLKHFMIVGVNTDCCN